VRRVVASIRAAARSRVRGARDGRFARAPVTSSRSPRKRARRPNRDDRDD
jgi:hypothetical protein